MFKFNLNYFKINYIFNLNILIFFNKLNLNNYKKYI